MQTYTVKAWNTYKLDDTGSMIYAERFFTKNPTDALSEAAVKAAHWNRITTPNRIITTLSCEGFVRAMY